MANDQHFPLADDDGDDESGGIDIDTAHLAKASALGKWLTVSCGDRGDGSGDDGDEIQVSTAQLGKASALKARVGSRDVGDTVRIKGKAPFKSF